MSTPHLQQVLCACDPGDDGYRELFGALVGARVPVYWAPVQIGRDRRPLAADDPADVLRSDRHARNVSRRWRVDGAQDLGLLVSNLLGAEVDRWLHRDVAEELKQAVLDQASPRPA